MQYRSDIILTENEGCSIKNNQYSKNKTVTADCNKILSETLNSKHAGFCTLLKYHTII